MRCTIVTYGRLAADQARLQAARAGQHGVQVMSMPGLAARLAGGFLRAIDAEALAAALGEVLQDPAAAPLGDLAPIGDLPGLQLALASTLGKAWRACIDLQARAAEHPRFATLATLEADVLKRLPPGMLRPAELAAAARGRLAHAPVVTGPVEVHGMTALEPVWQGLLLELGSHVPVSWHAGAREVPAWLDGTEVAIRRTTSTAATPTVVSCATARHEVIEALRWARALLASGAARAEEIAIVAASPAAFDDIVEAAVADANLQLHFAHGRPALFTREGQTAAALADILLRGLSQARLRRLVALAAPAGGALHALPETWRRVLPEGAPLGTPARWQIVCDDAGEDGAAVAAVLMPVVELLHRRPEAAAEAGETILCGLARTLWRRALDRESAAAIERSLSSLRVTDPADPACSIIWGPAAELAAAPRPFVRLLGLNAQSWPRQSREDPLLPTSLVPAAVLDVLPVAEADRRDFASICGGTARELVLSCSRRDATGRLLGRSPLLPDAGARFLRRAAVPSHAMSEADRLMARPAEFARKPRAQAADAVWRDWLSPGITPHDGLVRAGHPAVQRVLARHHSATSLKKLLRNPLGFVWQYALGLRAPDEEAEPFRLDPLTFGTLTHEIIAASLRVLATAEDAAGDEPKQIAAAVAGEAGRIGLRWQASMPLPPPLLWRRTLDQAAALATDALSHPLRALDGQTTWPEVPFNVDEPPEGAMPWDAAQPVQIPGTSLALTGQIDRLDLAGNRSKARVVDFKTGNPPRDIAGRVLAGGGELQRCLYIAAVRALLGTETEVEAALLYPRSETPYYPLPDPDGALATLVSALNHSLAALQAGLAVPGPDTGGDYDDLAFALPSQQGSVFERKREAAAVLLGPAAEIWEAA